MTEQENLTHYYKQFHIDANIPENHIQYLHKLKESGVEPVVIYDIGSAILHWTKNAKEIWPSSHIIAFEALDTVEDFYKDYPIPHSINVFTDVDDRELTFYEHSTCVSGNSYYRENSIAADTLYPLSEGKKKLGKTIDTVVFEKKFPLPDFVKIDVQGAEIDILRGMKNTLKYVKHLIVELQHVEYNTGAMLEKDSIPIIESMGFKLVIQPSGHKDFCGNGPDADYHFIKVN